jgi:hypothetical protein
MKTVKFRLSGDVLMLQNGQTANPRNQYAKRLKELGKDKKRKGADVDAILDQMSDVEVESCLYWRDDLGIYMPASNIRAALIDGAKLSKGGANVKRYCMVTKPAKIIYDGPQTVEGIVADPDFRYDAIVKVGMVKVPKSRAIIRDWSCEVEVDLMPGNVIDERDIIKYMTDAGLYCGIGASRTLAFGRFEVEVANAKGKFPKRKAASLAAK